MSTPTIDRSAGVEADHAPVMLTLEDLDRLVVVLRADGYDVLGPVVRDGVIGHDSITGVADLPAGWGDRQEPGRYRLVEREDRARFGYAVGPQSWKELLHPARVPVWSMTRLDDGTLDVRMHDPEPVRRAFLGVRPCELAAIAKQDRVLARGPHPDPTWVANRADLVLIAVECGSPAATCFCPSMGTGPDAGTGADLVLTELVDGDDVGYLARAETPRGTALLNRLGGRPVTESQLRRRAELLDTARRSMTRTIETEGIAEMLDDRLDSPHWAGVAERCLTCANCTLACPTCFCTDLVDVTDLGGDHSDRWRVWDSCFSLEFSHLGPGPHRASGASRYRQWLVHKLGSWIAQFGESGCVGCGRCITWCPVGIDITAEVAALRASPADSRSVGS